MAAALGLLWDSHGALMGLPRGYHGDTTGLSRGSHGVLVGLLWGSRGVRTHGAFMRPLMGLSLSFYAAFMGPWCELYGNADMSAVFRGRPPLRVLVRALEQNNYAPSNFQSVECNVGHLDAEQFPFRTL